MLRHAALSALLLSGLVLPTVAAEPSVKAKQKLYVTNSGGDDLHVIDVATNKVIGRIEVGPHPHGLAAPAAQDVIYVTIEGKRPGELVCIDTATDKVTRRMDVGPAPNQLAVTPDGKIAYVPSDDEHWDVVDLEKFKILSRIKTGGRPHNTLCSPDGKRMYLAPMGSPHKVTVVDVETHKPIGEIPFGDVVRPITLSQDEKRLYAEVDNLVGFEVADVAERKLVNRIEANLTPDQKKTKSRSHGLCLRPDQKELWECDVEHFDVHVYDVTGDKPKQIATIPIGGQIYWLTFNPNGKTCYVAGRGKGEVAVVDTETKKVTATIPVGKVPKRLLVVTPPEIKSGR
jgi:YVTN family beta-propeller protein